MHPLVALGLVAGGLFLLFGMGGESEAPEPVRGGGAPAPALPGPVALGPAQGRPRRNRGGPSGVGGGSTPRGEVTPDAALLEEAAAAHPVGKALLDAVVYMFDGDMEMFRAHYSFEQGSSLFRPTALGFSPHDVNDFIAMFVDASRDWDWNPLIHPGDAYDMSKMIVTSMPLDVAPEALEVEEVIHQGLGLFKCPPLIYGLVDVDER